MHRDLKPANVMLTPAGPKLLDFGLAKSTAGTPRGDVHDVPGTILGTMQYMAPEQLDGVEADRRTDIFAFGVDHPRDGDGQESVRGQEPGAADLRDRDDEPPPVSQRASRDARRARLRRQDVPGKGSGGSVAERPRSCRRAQGIADGGGDGFARAVRRRRTARAARPGKTLVDSAGSGRDGAGGRGAARGRPCIFAAQGREEEFRIRIPDGRGPAQTYENYAAGPNGDRVVAGTN